MTDDLLGLLSRKLTPNKPSDRNFRDVRLCHELPHWVGCNRTPYSTSWPARVVQRDKKSRRPMPAASHWRAPSCSAVRVDRAAAVRLRDPISGRHHPVRVDGAAAIGGIGSLPIRVDSPAAHLQKRAQERAEGGCDSHFLLRGASGGEHGRGGQGEDQEQGKERYDFAVHGRALSGMAPLLPRRGTEGPPLGGACALSTQNVSPCAKKAGSRRHGRGSREGGVPAGLSGDN